MHACVCVYFLTVFVFSLISLRDLVIFFQDLCHMLKGYLKYFICALVILAYSGSITLELQSFRGDML